MAQSMTVMCGVWTAGTADADPQTFSDSGSVARHEKLRTRTDAVADPRTIKDIFIGTKSCYRWT